jgi:RNA polymerase sigma-70 factor, ECF subfamily
VSATLNHLGALEIRPRSRQNHHVAANPPNGDAPMIVVRRIRPNRTNRSATAFVISDNACLGGPPDVTSGKETRRGAQREAGLPDAAAALAARPPAIPDVTCPASAGYAGRMDERADSLWESVYDELRVRARTLLARERRSHTLQPTALVHEAFLRLRAHRAAAAFDEVEIYRAAANAMRRILVEHARRRKRLKRLSPSPRPVSTFEGDVEGLPMEAGTILDIDAALTAMANIDSRSAEIVRLRFYAGLSEVEVAALLNLSRRTVQADFRTARAWLASFLAANREASP